MRTPRHLLPALLALLAMTFSIAEAVWVSTCAPTMAQTVVATGAEPDCMTGMAGGCGGENPERDGRQCPFGPLSMVQGCVVFPSMPARAAEAPVPAPSAVASCFAERVQRNSLSGSAIFHPPRA